MRVGIIGTGAIAHKHAQAYQNIGFEIAACSNKTEASGKAFAAKYGARFIRDFHELCRDPEVDFVDVCAFPDFRLEPVCVCAGYGKPIQVQKPMATDLATAREMIDVAKSAGITLGVVSQHRFDDSTLFVKRAIEQGRLGTILQGDAYVKWYRSPEYYSRPVKGSWKGEGGGALINQGIHQVDVLLWLLGPVSEITARWHLGGLHKIESEDVLNALLSYRSGALGIIQSATAFWPGYTERLEVHGAKGTAIISGDRLTSWDVLDDHGEPPPLASNVASGSSDPMAISLAPFERQFRDFAEAIEAKREPLVSGEAGYQALELVIGAYRSCREGSTVRLDG